MRWLVGGARRVGGGHGWPRGGARNKKLDMAGVVSEAASGSGPCCHCYMCVHALAVSGRACVCVCVCAWPSMVRVRVVWWKSNVDACG